METFVCAAVIWEVILFSFQDFRGELPQSVSWEAVGDQAQLCRFGLSALWPATAGPADADEGRWQAAEHAFWQGEKRKMTDLWSPMDYHWLCYIYYTNRQLLESDLFSLNSVFLS